MPKTFPHPIQISDIDGRSCETMTALVNAGAFFTTIPADTLARLGITPTDKMEFELPDGSLMCRDMAHAWVIVGRHKVPTTVVFDQNGAQPRLGEHTLEGLGLEVDEAKSRLTETPYFFAVTPIAVEPMDMHEAREWVASAKP